MHMCDLYTGVYGKLFGIIWSLSAWLKWNYFNAMIMMIMLTVVH